MDAAELIRLNNLQLVAKAVSDRVLQGIQPSRRLGSGSEFEHYRAYQPGDDLRRIDWKLFARSGRYQVKEAAVESHMHVRFVLDLTGSMNYQEGEVSRLAYAKLLLGSLAYLAFRQGDAMSLHLLKETGLEQVVPEGKNAFYRILYQLENAQAAGKLPAKSFPELHRKSKELMILFTDLLQEEAEWLHLIQGTVSPHRQLMIFQVLGKQEVDFDLSGMFRFVDMESGRVEELQGEAVRKKYLAAFGNYLEELDAALRMPGVQLVRARMDDSPARVLVEALNSGSKWNF